MSLLEVKHLSHGFGDKVLYQNATFELYKGEHMGVVGQNGTGKSTLINILTGEVIADEGEILWQNHIRIGHLDQYAQTDGQQTILEYLKTAFAPLIELDRAVAKAYERYAQTLSEQDLAQASQGQARLEAQDYYTMDTQINQIVKGLGLDAIGVGRLLGELSGGQRAKVILGKLLLEKPDVLLLDEPTNFLDQEHIDWLVEFLSGFSGAFLVVSHDFTFLDRVTTSICDIEAQTIRKYHGAYTHYLRQKEALREDHIRRYHAQQMMIKQTEEFIRKNIAGIKSKNAKGRRKQLERLERIAPPSYLAKPDIHFPCLPLLATKALVVKKLRIGYTQPLLPAIDLTVRSGEKLVVTGFNGIGKSTFLKTLTGILPKLSGAYHFTDAAKIGYYEQELQWPYPEETPLQIIANADASLTQKRIRKRLAECGVRDDNTRQPISSLSGGEQSKVKLCRMLLSPSNFLILDELTNHMDTDTKDSLKEALTEFTGCVLLVSHEPDFYQGFADRVFEIQQ